MTELITTVVIGLVIVFAVSALRETKYLWALKRTEEGRKLWLLSALYYAVLTLTVSACYFAVLATIRLTGNSDWLRGTGWMSGLVIVATLAVPTMLGRQLRKRRNGH